MNIAKITRPYTIKNNRRASLELIATFASYLAFLIAAIMSAPNWMLVLPFMALNGIAAVRLYMLQHDCMHRSFFTSRRANDVVGTLLSPFTLTPYKSTRYSHNMHHAHVGDLDRRDAFEIDIMTLDEFRTAPILKKLWYRLYRSPFTLVFAGPFIFYVILRRFPRNGIKTGVGDVLLHNAMLGAFVFCIFSFSGWTGVLIFLGAIYLGVSPGALIPYVVHNFEAAHWGRKPELTFESAALSNTSVLDLGSVFDFVTANIAYHDLHHLNAMIPSYNLKTCYREVAPHLNSVKVNWGEIPRCLKWKLYDEENNQMVGFSAV
jgi:omega-6 fatty acid desaturase (delta-12 desaturase)